MSTLTARPRPREARTGHGRAKGYSARARDHQAQHGARGDPARGVAYATVIQSFSWNQTSHYDLIRSLDQDKTTIDPYQENTGDKAFYKGHWYSARAPGLALFALPYYDAIKGLGAEQLARSSQAQRGEDEMVYFIGLWANVLPGPAAAAARRPSRRAHAARLRRRHGGDPGPGHAHAAALHAALLPRLHGVPRLCRVRAAVVGARGTAQPVAARRGRAGARLCGVSEYPLFFVAVVLGLYLLSRRDSLTPQGRG